MSTRKGGLGRGLGSLIPAGEPKQLSSVVAGVSVDVANLNRVSINSISPNPRQPRTVFDEEKMGELITSIKEVGVLQPPVVRIVSDGRYELIMGERRWRAAKAAGLTEIPVIIRQTPDNQLLREALLENIHRSELNALEEGAAYEQLLNDFNYTHDELAQKIGRSRPHITNTLRLLQLPPSVQRRVAAG
ncbi:MAG: ParB/RepB/Spo0J family partition protein, partial [Actinomycetota bacterium]